MGRDARIKRERRRAAQALPPPPVVAIPETNLEILTTAPFVGHEDAVSDDGYFDDCAICRALRAGNIELALQHMRDSDGYVDLREVDEIN